MSTQKLLTTSDGKVLTTTVDGAVKALTAVTIPSDIPNSDTWLEAIYALNPTPATAVWKTFTARGYTASTTLPQHGLYTILLLNGLGNAFSSVLVAWTGTSAYSSTHWSALMNTSSTTVTGSRGNYVHVDNSGSCGLVSVYDIGSGTSVVSDIPTAIYGYQLLCAFSA